MGSRLHGNDGGTHIVIPAAAGIHGGGPAGMGPRLHGDDDGRRRAHHTIVIPATAGIHGGGPGDGFPSFTGTTKGGGNRTAVGRRRTHFPSARERRWAV